ncbi:type VII secretion protein EssC [Paenibacillus sp. 7124]|uniref:Type VII secretion protein EssC n=1 Tax=Paenibacillus apii TaxID=1850370 RepID=A0A6M1PI19_9BACL|nr:type VII secretion protein EssC [Paenibacillus apii]NGM82826.1 type VII secretion protein EssC [Paenibacillus apii]NJJ39966.1 type VII secretion protein EssC [Paenibacillus apii]
MQTEFSRQPRFLPDIPRGEVEVPDPPMLQEKPEISWYGILLPPIVMLVITVLIAMTSQSLFLLISVATTVMTLFGSLGGAVTQIRRYTRKKKEREQKYLQFITDTRSELSVAREQQSAAMNEMFPEPAECVRRIMETDSRLWEKTPVHNDFLAVRVGVGSAPLEMEIRYTKQAIVMESDPLLMEPQRLAMDYAKVPGVPITVNLLETEICGLAGEAAKTEELLKSMLLQVVTHQGYDDVRIVLLTEGDGMERWSWLKFLPHLWDDGMNVRFLLCGKALAHQVLSEMYALLKDRELRTAGGGALPHYLFIVEDASLLENEPISKYLYNGSSKLGVSTIFVAPNAAYLPMNCKVVIGLQGKHGEMASRVTGEKTAFTPDQADLKELDLAARKLAPLRIKHANAGFTLPSSISLMDMLEAEKVTDTDCILNWTRNKTYMGMSVPIGARAGGEPLYLDMHETGYGPHGLVAGTTGSGKSELLQSIIVSQAIHYHPHDIAFVLIDYKGGGMADAFKGMPHLVGTITNLDGNQTNRALLSIKSELMRRQRVFSEYGVNSIDKYQKLYYSRPGGAGMPAIPHLIMIADEFAELKQDQPDFMKELVSTARVGRSLGVHLILATQKPAGVVDDQIWSNSKFKICLKVQDEADSRDVIKRPDAAMIKEPGRAYIQVGNDEIFELFQSAYSGADYDPRGELQKLENKTKRIYKVSVTGRSERIYPLEEEKIARHEVPSQLQAMVEHITRTAEQFGIKPVKGPWLPPLPDTVFLDDLVDAACADGIRPRRESLFSIPAGLLDDPRGQRQEALAFDFAGEGNLFVYGAPGTGKTVLLRTLLLSAALLYTPDEVHFYMMDFGGGSLKSLEQLPHVGGVMTLEQEEKIDQFMRFVFRIMEERRALFEESGSEGFADYRADGRDLPAVVLMIDNYFALSETYEDIDAQMVVLAREGFKYGIYLVATATNSALVRYKFSVNFKMAVSLQMTEKNEYDGIVGRTEGLEPAKTAGRGLVRGKPPLEFQTALPEFRELRTDALIERIEERFDSRAVPIPVMPVSIDLRAIAAEGSRLAIGLASNDLQPVHIDLQAHPVLMVAGDAMSGKSTLLVSWISLLAERERELEVYALDSSGMGIFELMNRPCVTDLAGVEDMFEFALGFKEKLDARRSELISCRMSGGDVAALTASWNPVVFVIDKLSELTGNDMYALHELLERIIRQDRGLKVSVIAADNTAELASNWDTLGKIIREEQTGLLLGRIKEQNLYSLSYPYGSQERNMEQGDGYLIVKNRYTGLRCGVLRK